MEEQNIEELPSANRLGFILTNTSFFIFILIAVICTIVPQYSKKYMVILNNNKVGYINTIEEYNEVINTITKEISSSYDITIKNKPEFKEVYTAKETDNIYTNLSNTLNVEYSYYTIKVGEEEINFYDIEEYKDYKVKLENTKLVTTIETKEEKKSAGVQELKNINNDNTINKYNTIVSRYRQKTLYQTIPAVGRTTSCFGWRILYGKSNFHTGYDIANVIGTPIKAWRKGTVTYTGYDDCGYGNYIIVKHSNGYESLYGHLSKINVSIGQNVSVGQKLGEIGSTGNSTGSHLHIEILINGAQVNPAPYMKNIYI